MPQNIAQFSVVVRDYDEALSFYIDKRGLERVEDTDLGCGKRWVRVRPAGSTGAGILLARAVSEEQITRVGDQTGGRVFIFLETDQFRRDYRDLVARGVTFVRPPTREAYGTVAGRTNRSHRSDVHPRGSSSEGRPSARLLRHR